MFNKIIITLLVALFAAVSANAHPLNNFSVNNFTRLEVEKNRINLRCVLDMAEIPTFQESQKIDSNKNGTLEQAELDAYLEIITPQYISNLKLLIDDQPVQIQALSKAVSLPLGEGDLPTLRVEWGFSGEISSTEKAIVQRLRFENNNYKERVGWGEIVINHVAGVSIFDSTAFGSAVTDELKTYPEDMLTAPLAEKSAEFSFSASAVPAGAKPLQNRNGSTSAAVQKDKFSELINVPEITPAIAFFGLLVAFGFGAMHAMSPGHGKTVVGAYLVGSRGTVKHALFLGLTVTVTHTLGVFALGLAMLFASNYILPEKIMPFLGFVSGLLVFFIGISLFKDRLFAALGWQSHHDGAAHAHDHEDHSPSLDQDEDHTHAPHGAGFSHTHGGSTHSHLPPENITWGNLLALGVSGGLLPCPSALVLMLSAINLQRVGYGLVLTTAFSFGLAATLTAVGLVFLYGGRIIDGSRLAGSRLVKMLPVASAFVIACVGAVICYSSLA